MPIYDYQDKKTKKTVGVIRSFKDYEIIPTLEEAKDSGMTDEEYVEAAWERFMAAGIQVTKGDNWGPGKGNWGR